MPDEPSRPWSPWRASPYITPEPLAKPRFRSRARRGRAEVRGGELCLPTHGLKAAALTKAMGRVTRKDTCEGSEKDLAARPTCTASLLHNPEVRRYLYCKRRQLLS